MKEKQNDRKEALWFCRYALKNLHNCTNHKIRLMWLDFLHEEIKVLKSTKSLDIS